MLLIREGYSNMSRENVLAFLGTLEGGDTLLLQNIYL